MLIRAGVVLVLLAVVWLFCARSLSLLVDLVFTVPIARLHASPVAWNGTYLQFGPGRQGVIGPKGWDGPDLLIGAHILGLEGPDDHPAATLEVEPANGLVMAAGGHKIRFAARAGVLPGDEGPVLAYAAEPGDVADLSVERSWLSWPTPFETNFMTGFTHSWRRSFYYRLSWKKASGARLLMLWRYEQGYDRVNGWTAPGGGGEPSGLIRVEITPAR